jgi:hypothetical protein
MIASLAYSQNSSVFDMAPSQCPDVSRSKGAPVPVPCREACTGSYYNFLCNYAAVTAPTEADGVYILFACGCCCCCAGCREGVSGRGTKRRCTSAAGSNASEANCVNSSAH